ncbi:hypothetical protein BpHYR1_031084 [Brachionus plicatilis]|uniref:Uncharacterized protein n=1 Tax=Brachionus plicatilis TaxID=10195 RepID=A0A3M7RI86_BRAPC|nr:hypothetical protein BpHYR1_031084 [Brachionus plicatilis]
MDLEKVLMVFGFLAEFRLDTQCQNLHCLRFHLSISVSICSRKSLIWSFEKLTVWEYIICLANKHINGPQS